MKLQKLFENDRRDKTKSRIMRPDDDENDKTKSRIMRPDDDDGDDGDDYDDVAAQMTRAAKGDPNRVTAYGAIVGTPDRMPPEKWKAWMKAGGEQSFGKTPIDDPLPPFPYHPGNAAVIDPEHQIYYVLKSEGPLHWRDVFAKIVPYLKEFVGKTERDTPKYDDYGEAVVKLLKRGVIHKTADGKYYTFDEPPRTPKRPFFPPPPPTPND